MYDIVIKNGQLITGNARFDGASGNGFIAEEQHFLAWIVCKKFMHGMILR